MIIIKSFFRKKSTKIYLILLSSLLTAFMILTSLITYFTNMQNNIYYESSEVIVFDNDDLYNKLEKIDNLKNIKRTLVFKENKNYDILAESNYTVTDSKGNIIDSYNGNTDLTKLTWKSMERQFLEGYVLVAPAREYNYNLKNNEIIFGIEDSSYNNYSTGFNKIIKQKTGFIFDNENIELEITDIITVDKPLVIISNDLYDKLINSGKQYAYIAKHVSFKEQTLLREKLKNLSDNDSYKYAVITYYSNTSANSISNLLDLLDILKLVSYITIISFLIFTLIILKNIINDFRNELLLDRKLGFSKNQIIKSVLICLLTLYFSSILLAAILFLLLAIIIYLTFNINLLFFKTDLLYKVLIIELLMFISVSIINTYNVKK